MDSEDTPTLPDVNMNTIDTPTLPDVKMDNADTSTQPDFQIDEFTPIAQPVSPRFSQYEYLELLEGRFVQRSELLYIDNRITYLENYVMRLRDELVDTTSDLRKCQSKIKVSELTHRPGARRWT